MATSRHLSNGVSRSKSRYREENDEYIRSVARRITRIPKEILAAAMKEALLTAAESTHQDSGNAAWHWSVGTLASPGQAPRTEGRVRYGQTPIGHRGDEGINADMVIDDVLNDGFERIDQMVFVERHVTLTLYNPIDPDGMYGMSAGLQDIRPEELSRNALEKARVAASKAMDEARTFNKGTYAEATYQSGKRIK